MSAPVRRLPCFRGVECGRFGRRIPNIDQLMTLTVAVKAGLRREEVIAVVLYTGPMVDVPLPQPRSTRQSCTCANFLSIPASRNPILLHTDSV